MQQEQLIASLENFPKTLKTMLAGYTHDYLRRKPPHGAWSILEIVCHLGDEEVSDFRKRLQLTLNDATVEWPGIDPEGWAIERQYNESDPADALQRFCTERKASVEWLRALPAPNWSLTYEHPKLGAIRAGDLLSSWASHDYLHLRQIAKRHYEMIGVQSAPYDSAYAGSWGI